MNCGGEQEFVIEAVGASSIVESRPPAGPPTADG